MTPAQALTHCSRSFGNALGDTAPPRVFIGRIIGGLIKGSILGNDKPFGHNAPTSPHMVVKEQPEFEAAQTKLLTQIDRFVAGGPAACSRHPHSFFGPLTPDEWAILMYKHTDHHLRQFGV
jgi:hypothetical protein